MSQRELVIAVTLGDPAGIGPEVVLKGLADPEIAPLARWVVVGDGDVLAREGERCGIPLASLPHVSVHHVPMFDEDTPVVSGRLDAACGRAAVAYVREATDMCLRGEAAAMVTAPLNKEAVSLSGLTFSGHTEYISERCAQHTGGPDDSRMMLTNPRLSVVHVTTHVALREACRRIAVCGLNPHASEHGLFGDEEDAAIGPAIEAARAQGAGCEGPFAPDTIFLDAWRGKWDLIIAMYHDQGHIPMKLLDFANTVNVTLGIPIVRTSVDHGTAFDIAGRNMADPRSMKAALRLAARMGQGHLPRQW
jgi:4-phospho-D-threonate 3-dehydrogenase / 4-phospho-D-erythronate 3-dehydrogenase